MLFPNLFLVFAFPGRSQICFLSKGACSRGGCLLRGVPALGGCLLPGGGACSGGPGGDHPPTATAAGGTHPTGMHSCIVLRSIRNPSKTGIE